MPQLKTVVGLTAVVLTAGLGLAGPASAAAPTTTSSAAASAHLPTLPFTVDGKQYQPQQMTQFAGRPLWFVVDLAKGRSMTGFTSRASYLAAVQATRGGVRPMTAGQYVTLYSGDELTGDSTTVNSGSGLSNLNAVGRGCFLWWCNGTWDNVASSVKLSGATTLYDGYDYSARTLYITGTGWGDLSWWGFDNLTSSVQSWW